MTPRASALETRSLLKPLSCQPIASASEAGTPLASAIEPTWPDVTRSGVGNGGRSAIPRRPPRPAARMRRRDEDDDAAALPDRSEHRAGDQDAFASRPLAAASDGDAQPRAGRDRGQRVAGLDDVGAARRARLARAHRHHGPGSGQSQHRAGDQDDVQVESIGGGERRHAHPGACGDRGQRVAGLDDVGAARGRSCSCSCSPAPCPGSGQAQHGAGDQDAVRVKPVARRPANPGSGRRGRRSRSACRPAGRRTRRRWMSRPSELVGAEDARRPSRTSRTAGGIWRSSR